MGGGGCNRTIPPEAMRRVWVGAPMTTAEQRTEQLGVSMRATNMSTSTMSGVEACASVGTHHELRSGDVHTVRCCSCYCNSDYDSECEYEYETATPTPTATATTRGP